MDSLSWNGFWFTCGRGVRRKAFHGTHRGHGFFLGVALTTRLSYSIYSSCPIHCLALFEDRCRHVQKCKCSHQACSSEEPDLYECNPTFSAPDFCSNCTTPRERKLSFKESVIQVRMHAMAMTMNAGTTYMD